MASTDSIPLSTMVRMAPARFGLFVALPLALATAQLLNSIFNGLPIAASIPFAIAMVAFAVLFARYTRSTLRLRRLEGGAVGTDFAPSD